MGWFTVNLSVDKPHTARNNYIVLLEKNRQFTAVVCDSADVGDQSLTHNVFDCGTSFSNVSTDISMRVHLIRVLV